MSAPRVVRRRASSGHVRGLAHLVAIAEGDEPEWQRLSTKAKCGFKPKRSWSTIEAAAWEQTCPKCEAKA
jgi:hypothetical protein